MARTKKTSHGGPLVASWKPKSPSSRVKPKACRECRRHKIFCSKDQPKCERCRIRSLECLYSGPKKIQVNESNLRFLKAKLQRYEDYIQTLPAEVVHSLSDKESPLGLPPDGEDDEENSVYEDEAGGDTLPDQLRHEGLESQESSDNIFRIASKLSGLHGADGSLDQKTVFYASGALPSRRLGSIPLQPIALPPIHIARRYFLAQHMYIGTIFAFSDPDLFDQQLMDAYDRGLPQAHDTKACLSYAKILVVLALGRLYSVNRQGISEAQQGGDNPPGFAYFSHALALLPDMHEEGSLLGVETLAYVGYFMQNMNRRDVAYLYIGLALRMAITLGLHEEMAVSEATASHHSTLAKAEHEHRRRVWWSIYSLDRILSLKSGNPISIHDVDISVNMPLRLPAEPENSPVVVLRCYTEMSRILGEIISLIYRRRSGPGQHTGQSLITSVHSILQSLTKWEEALPRHLRLDLLSNHLSRESVSIYLHYYQCITMTARPLLFQVVQKRLVAIRAAATASLTSESSMITTFTAAVAERERDWKTGLSKKTVSVIAGCIAAARTTISIMTKASARNMVATFGYMDGEYILSSSIVLALVWGSFPKSAEYADSLTHGLALMQRMGELGNSYVATRYRLLVRLKEILAAPGSEHVEPLALLTNNASKSLGNSSASSGDSEIATHVSGIPSPMALSPNIPCMPFNQFPASDRHQLQQYQQQPPNRLLQEQPSPLAFADQMIEFSNCIHPVIDTSSTMFDTVLLEDSESNLWTAAFTNSAGLEFFQFMPEVETDMIDFLGL